MYGQTVVSENGILLMSSSEFANSEAFLADKIYPQLLSDWTKNDGELLTSWKKYCLRFYPSPKTIDNWQELLIQYDGCWKEFERGRNEKERRRLIFQIKKFHEDMKEREEEIQKLKVDGLDGKNKYKLYHMVNPSDGKISVMR